MLLLFVISLLLFYIIGRNDLCIHTYILLTSILGRGRSHGFRSSVSPVVDLYQD